MKRNAVVSDVEQSARQYVCHRANLALVFGCSKFLYGSKSSVTQSSYNQVKDINRL
jgi:hypothetical protein